MRKIEREMNAAIARRNVWMKDNTAVLAAGDEGMQVCLHGHRIATVRADGTIDVDEVTLNRYPTNTTLSRLRALGVDVCRRNHSVILRGRPLFDSLS